jgi:regulator of protease activity HflC (stomatin/prohibitin superfamily)
VLEWIVLSIILILIFALAFLARAIVIIKPYEEGIYIFMGTFKRVLKPGLNFVSPVFREIIIVDERVQTLDVPRQEVITKDNSPTNVDAVIYIKVVDPKKAVFQVQNYKVATVLLAQTYLRAVIGDMDKAR